MAIESSCDDTAVAVLKGREVLVNLTANQAIHSQYGGVVPELASRAHQKKLLPLVKEALQMAGISGHDLNFVSFTAGPGLLGSLLVGGSFARGYSMALGIKAYPINHMRAHILAHFVADAHANPPVFPFLCLTVSGGHTQLIKVMGVREFSILGETLDDAAGEAFDKAAKMLGLNYPGGPEIDRLAQSGNSKAFVFPQPKIQGLDFSFSGLKTSFLYTLQKIGEPPFTPELLANFSASVQGAIVKALIGKLELAVLETGIKTVAIAGGVSANSALRQALLEKSQTQNWEVFVPPMRYCTDNAAMIGICAQLDWEEGLEPENLPISPRWSL